MLCGRLLKPIQIKRDILFIRRIGRISFNKREGQDGTKGLHDSRFRKKKLNPLWTNVNVSRIYTIIN